MRLTMPLQSPETRLALLELKKSFKEFQRDHGGAARLRSRFEHIARKMIREMREEVIVRHRGGNCDPQYDPHRYKKELKETRSLLEQREIMVKENAILFVQ